MMSKKPFTKIAKDMTTESGVQGLKQDHGFTVQEALY